MAGLIGANDVPSKSLQRVVPVDKDIELQIMDPEENPTSEIKTPFILSHSMARTYNKLYYLIIRNLLNGTRDLSFCMIQVSQSLSTPSSSIHALPHNARFSSIHESSFSL